MPLPFPVSQFFLYYSRVFFKGWQLYERTLNELQICAGWVLLPHSSGVTISDPDLTLLPVWVFMFLPMSVWLSFSKTCQWVDWWCFLKLPLGGNKCVKVCSLPCNGYPGVPSGDKLLIPFDPDQPKVLTEEKKRKKVELDYNYKILIFISYLFT